MMFVVFILLTTGVPCWADFLCLCNYNVETTIFREARDDAEALGYLYEFDCKYIIPGGQLTSGWSAIGYEHQVGYVKRAGQIEEQVCPGGIPDADKVPESSSPTTAILSTTTTTIAPKPTTITTSTTPRLTTTTPTTTPRPITTTTTTTTATPLPTPTTTTTTPRPTSKTTKTTTTPIPTTISTTTTTTPTLASSTITSTRLSQQTTTLFPIFTNLTPLRLVTTTTAAPSVVYGQVNLCPAILHQYTREDQGALQQYGDYCYEIVPIRAIWAKAENDCRAKGGHLIHISSKGLQDFIYQWIKSLQFDHACWTGLHDLRTEEQFEWISGDHVIYQNFHPDRKGNLASHYNENCVLLVPYEPYFGQWDDVICGDVGIFGDTGQQNPFICEYSILPRHSSPIVG
ncbi:brevican core protein-like [Dreissena polymorpha]|uniref:C-type lectin domain-containing protein n=1 Tax=Dreissena polymorpha TaxID=45954 RepID=A0A9D4EIB1_DREPO|nr:brevican core protein-like [Dreissena polymorpha]XP_052228453.1 brevican core protein-like [Dreissena polymorpha]KAH3779774.1 hypothetical protein DPMN_157580 [Dreissena polymorpha]